jgi:signal transduction histidine kinase
VLIVTALATVAMGPTEGGNETALPFALYAVAVYASARQAWVGFAGTAVVSTVAAALGLLVGGMDLGTAVATAIGLTAIMLIATLIGVNVGNRKRYVQALVDRARQLVRERDQQARLAAASERSRIAREMHDIVSHSLTVMVTLAEGSAAAAATSSASASTAMRQVAETGRQALSDMRRMLGVLHADDESRDSGLQPQPGVGDLDELVAHSRAAGLPVTLTSAGEPPSDPAEQLTIYRIVQESLTNSLRHAGSPSIVSVDVEHTAEATHVRVADDGSGPAEVQEPGHGLLGMRERVALYGGFLEAGPGEGGGWVVDATIPRGASS